MFHIKVVQTFISSASEQWNGTQDNLNEMQEKTQQSK